jgi:hypothetical protein
LPFSEAIGVSAVSHARVGLRTGRLRGWIVGATDSRETCHLPSPNEGWRDLSQIATVEVTSEDARFEIESALRGAGSGWKASTTGDQRIRLIFDEPISLSRI